MLIKETDMEFILYHGEIAKQTKYANYYATKSGKIVSCKVKGGQGSTNYNNPREMAYKIDKDGYLECCLSIVEDKKHKRIYRRAHRLVWEAWNGDIPGDLTIDHIDTNPQNNDLSNLRLMTRAMNTSIARKNSVSPKRTKYLLYHHGLCEILDSIEMKTRFQLSTNDLYKQTTKVKLLHLQGYAWTRVPLSM